MKHNLEKFHDTSIAKLPKSLHSAPTETAFELYTCKSQNPTRTPSSYFQYNTTMCFGPISKA